MHPRYKGNKADESAEMQVWNAGYDIKLPVGITPDDPDIEWYEKEVPIDDEWLGVEEPWGGAEGEVEIPEESFFHSFKAPKGGHSYIWVDLKWEIILVWHWSWRLHHAYVCVEDNQQKRSEWVDAAWTYNPCR